MTEKQAREQLAEILVQRQRMGEQSQDWTADFRLGVAVGMAAALGHPTQVPHILGRLDGIWQDAERQWAEQLEDELAEREVEDDEGEGA